MIKRLYFVLGHFESQEVHSFDLLMASCPVANEVDAFQIPVNKAVSCISDAAQSRNLLSSKEKSHALLLLSLLGPILPRQWSEMMRLELLEYSTGKCRRLDTTLVIGYSRDCMRPVENDDQHDRVILRRSFQAWWAMSPSSIQRKKSSELLGLADSMACYFAKVLSFPSVASAVVYELILQIPENELVGRCLDFIELGFHNDTKELSAGSINFLNVITSHDFRRFGPSFLRVFVKRSSSLKRIFFQGLLDVIVLRFVKKFDELPKCAEESLQVTSFILSRCEKALARLVSSGL